MENLKLKDKIAIVKINYIRSQGINIEAKGVMLNGAIIQVNYSGKTYGLCSKDPKLLIKVNDYVCVKIEEKIYKQEI